MEALIISYLVFVFWLSFTLINNSFPLFKEDNFINLIMCSLTFIIMIPYLPLALVVGSVREQLFEILGEGDDVLTDQEYLDLLCNQFNIR